MLFRPIVILLNVKKVLLFLLVILITWDLLWALLGVKPLLPWRVGEISGGNRQDVLLLDVRTPSEYNWFHLPGALNIPLGEGLADSLQTWNPKTIVVICMTGHRSPFIAYGLKKKGYAGVYNLTGGMVAWKIYGLFAP